MFEFSGHRMDANGRLSRRCLLRAGVLGLSGLSLVDLARARADQSRQADDLSVILVWLDGGPPQHETYDPKPQTPAEIRGPYGTMSTCVPGIDVSEVLPCHAAVMDKMSIIRSMRHTLDVNFGDHFTSEHVTLTGYDGGVRDGRTAPVNPSFGSVVAKLKGARRSGVPPYVGLPEMHTTNLYPGYHSATYLGSTLSQAWNRSRHDIPRLARPTDLHRLRRDRHPGTLLTDPFWCPERAAEFSE
jgi:hypothetical protein